MKKITLSLYFWKILLGLCKENEEVKRLRDEIDLPRILPLKARTEISSAQLSEEVVGLLLEYIERGIATLKEYEAKYSNEVFVDKIDERLQELGKIKIKLERR